MAVARGARAARAGGSRGGRVRGRGALVAARAEGAGPTEFARGRRVGCVVVGGGISGLCTAQALTAKHAGDVLVTEARDRVGGNITTVGPDERGYLWEEGPNSFQPNDQMLEAAVDAGCADELVFGDSKAPRFVYWDNELRPTPSGPDALTFTLLSPLGKIRAGLGAVGLLNGEAPGYEESVEQFIRRNLGDEVYYRLIEPFCSGVYAGDPTKLSMKAAFGKIHVLEEKGGSLVGGALKLMMEKRENPDPPRDPRLPEKPGGQTVGSFRKGLATLPRAIERNLKDVIQTDWKLKVVEKETGGFALTYDTPEGSTVVHAQSVVLTTPSYVTADLLRREIPDVHQFLMSFQYPPVGAVTLAYPKSALRADRLDEDGNFPGFGQLHPRTQGVTTLGTIYSSSLFPGRCADDQVLLLNYIGGTLNRGIVDQSEDELVAQVDRDIRKMLIRPDAPAPEKVGVRVWPKAIPQFELNHMETLEGARAAIAEAGYEGLFLGGNYTAGVALGKCVEAAYNQAADVAAFCAGGGGGGGSPAPAADLNEVEFT